MRRSQHYGGLGSCIFWLSARAEYPGHDAPDPVLGRVRKLLSACQLGNLLSLVKPASGGQRLGGGYRSRNFGRITGLGKL